MTGHRRPAGSLQTSVVLFSFGAGSEQSSVYLQAACGTQEALGSGLSLFVRGAEEAP